MWIHILIQPNQMRHCLPSKLHVGIPPIFEAPLQGDSGKCWPGVKMQSGSDHYVDMHLVFRSHMPIDEVHRQCDLLEAKVAEHLPSTHVLVHAEPFGRLRFVKAR